MNRRVKIVFLFVLLFLIAPSVTSAAAHKSNDSSCAEVNVAIADYDSIVQELKSIDCENTDDVEEMNICNTNNNKKAYLLSKLFKLNDDRPECRSSTLSDIIKDNKDECHSVLDSSIKDISNNILTIFYIIAPFLLIIFGSIDFAKIMAANDPHRIVKHRRDFVRRVLAMLGVYLLPVIVNFIIGLNISGASLDGNVYACNKSLNYNVNTWETTYVPKTTTGSNIRNGGTIGVNSVGVQAMIDAATQLSQKAVSENWFYYNKYDADDFPDILSRTDTLRFGNIRASVYDTGATCCATLIGDVLYLSNVFSEEEVNSYRYNGATGTYYFLKEHGWQDITEYSQLEAGDVIFFKYDGWYSGTWTRGGALSDGGKHEEWGHVELYAGNNTWFNFGSTKGIRTVSPFYADKSSGYKFDRGLRMP